MKTSFFYFARLCSISAVFLAQGTLVAETTTEVPAAVSAAVAPAMPASTQAVVAPAPVNTAPAMPASTQAVVAPTPVNTAPAMPVSTQAIAAPVTANAVAPAAIQAPASTTQAVAPKATQSHVDDSSEVKAAQALTPDPQKGKEIYETCALCHTPEGWGSPDGRFPQIAGQHASVLIKQLADIRAGNRDNPTMYPFAISAFKNGSQGIADIAAYIEKLPMVPNNGVGPGIDLAYGKKLYVDNCAKCHGENGEGDAKEFYPRIHGQHFNYIMRQLHWIQIGKRRNADPKMTEQLRSFNGRDIIAVADYVSRLEPDAALLAEKNDWRNPDFSTQFLSAPKVQEALNQSSQ